MKIKRGIGIGYWQNQNNNNVWTAAEVKDLATRYERFETRYDPQVAQIRGVQPDAFIECYRSFEAVYFATAIDTSNGRTTPQAWLDAGATGEPPPAWNEWFDFVANDVPLKNQAGEYLINSGYTNERACDPANPWYRNYLKKWCENRLALGYSAIFADCLRPFFDLAHYPVFPVNPRTGQLYTHDEYAKDIRDLVDYVKSDMYVKIIANGLNQADSTYGYLNFKAAADLLIEKLDGQMIEGPWGWTVSDFNSRSQTRYKQNLDLLKQLMADNKVSDLHNKDIGNMRFSFCSHMLIVKSGSPWSIKYGSWVQTEKPEWQALTGQNYGEPLEDYQVNGSVFSRRFEYATISVNYADKTSKIIWQKNIPWNGPAHALTESLTSWDQVLLKGDKWGFNVVRIVVRFSLLDYTQLDAVLAKIAAHGAKAVIDNHLLSQWVDTDPKFGSQAMRDKWVEVVTKLKDDDRIIAWEIANEPFSNVWDGVNVTSDADVFKEYAIITDLIRAIDPSRAVVWMTQYNINPGANLRDNVVWTAHPYLYDSTSNPLNSWENVLNIYNYRTLQIRTAMAFGYSGGWIGEIETKDPTKLPSLTNWQWDEDYTVLILNYGIDKGYGISYWKYSQARDDGRSDPDIVWLKSNYVAPPVTPPTPIPMRYSLTYYGNYQDWSQITDATLDRDFKRFKDDGIELIILPTFWNAVESTRGTYSQAVVSRLNHIVDKAAAYNLKVIHNIHTWSTGSNVPSYIGNQRETFKDAAKRTDWLNFVKAFITQLDKPNVEGYQLCNELGLNQYPNWINADGSITPEMFYSWMRDTYMAGKSVTSKPLAPRFGMIQAGPTYLIDETIKIWDYICLNYYDGIDTQSTLQGLIDRSTRFANLGKHTWITEYGLKTQDDEAQRKLYAKVLSYFTQIGAHTAVNWWWSGLRGPATDDARYYNVADGSGIPRPAYYEITGSDIPYNPDLSTFKPSGVGKDYKQITQTDIDNAKNWGLDHIRLAMSFTSGSYHSLYNWVDLDITLTLLETNGLKAGLDLHNWQDMAGFFGSQGWIDQWAEIADLVKNDDRVIYLELFNEPFQSNWHTSVTNRTQVREAYTRCTDAIIATGYSKPIVWADPWYITDNVWAPQDLASEKYYGKVVIACHDWYRSDQTVSDRIARDNLWSQYYRVWLGEWNEWHPQDGSLTQATKDWAETIGKWYLSKDLGFNAWLHGKPADQIWVLTDELFTNIGLEDSEPEPVEPLTVIYSDGYSTTPTSLANCQLIIDDLKKRNLKTIRLASNPKFTQGTRPWTPEYVDYFLDNWDGLVIVDRNHFTDNTTLPMTGDKSWATIEQSIYDDVLSRWGYTDDLSDEEKKRRERVVVEVINEYPNSEMYLIVAAIELRIRLAGYRNAVMVNKHNIAHDWPRFASEAPNLQGYGKHWYFNSEDSNYNKYSEFIAHMTEALQNNCVPLCNTEIGAHSSEYWSFTAENVGRLNDALAWSRVQVDVDGNRLIFNLIWMNKDLNNLQRYIELGLNLGDIIVATLNIKNEKTTNLVITKIVETPVATVTPGQTATITVVEGDNLVFK